MPVGLGTALKIGGSLLGSALGGRGQGNRNTRTSGSRSSTSTSQQEGLQEVLENPILQPLRALFSGALVDTLGRANQPVFGEAQIAQQLQNINDLTDTANTRLRQRLAGTGALNSGQLTAGATGLEANRSNQITQFLGNLPFQEQQAQLARIAPLLQLGLGFTGRGPSSVRTSGQSSRTTNENFNQTSNTQGQQGGGFFQNLAGQGGDLLGLSVANDLGLLPNVFGGGQQQQSPGNFTLRPTITPEAVAPSIFTPPPSTGINTNLPNGGFNL